MANTDKPFNIKLSDEHRAKLETYRAARGLRSEADAVRDLIDRADGDAEAEAFIAERRASIAQSARGVRRRAVEGSFKLEADPPAVHVPLAERKAFNPQPKPGKAKR